MGSLSKRSGSPYWTACFDVVLADGSTRRLKKSTKKSKRSEALIEMQRLEDLEQKRVNDGGDVRTDKAYTVLAEATEAAAKGELSEARARALIAQLAEFSTGKQLRFYTVRQWSEEWLGLKKATSKGTTMARYKGSVALFLAWLGEKAGERLEAVTKEDARKFRDAVRAGWNPVVKKPKRKLSTAKRTAKTTNHFARDVAGMFRAAVREGLLIASPFTGLEKLPEDDSLEREVFTFPEVGLLVETVSKDEWQKSIFSEKAVKKEIRAARSRDWQGLILLGLYGGPRIGDCARLKKSAINMVERFFSFMPSKTERKKKRLIVPIHPRLAAWLEGQLKAIGDSEFLFPALCKTSVAGKAGLSSQFVAIMAAAGVGRGTVRSASEGRRAQHARGFHSLRHSLTSALANADVPEEIRRRIVGHDSKEVHQIYTHHERQTLATALEKLPSV